MNVLNLPVEIGAIMYSYFDLKTKISVHNSSYALRNYFRTWCHLEEVVLSRSTLATVETLNENLFLDFGLHVKELDLSGVHDLTAANLKPHMKKFPNLTRLDVTYTNIALQELHDICPINLRSIGINFFKGPSAYYRNTTVLIECKEFFRRKQFEAIHFVVYVNMHSVSPISFLGNIHTANLKLTMLGAIYYNELEDNADQNDIANNFDRLTVTLSNYLQMPSDHLLALLKLNFNQLEYIFIKYGNNIVVKVSPIFLNIFSVNPNLTVEVSPHLDHNIKLDGNIDFKAWNKATTKFDGDFFRNLLKELKDYFPTYICTHRQTKIKSIPNCPSNWCSIDGSGGFEKILGTVPEYVTFTRYCRTVGRLVACRPIGIPHQTKGLQNLTYLHINKIALRHDFFAVLFTECPKMATLVISTSAKYGMNRYMLALADSIHLAKLKNFMMITESVAYTVIFEILSRCPSMENVHIVSDNETFGDENGIHARNIVLFIEKCINLYSLLIEANLYPEELTMLLLPLKEAAYNLERKHLWVDVCEYCSRNPFVDVFSPSPLLINY